MQLNQGAGMQISKAHNRLIAGLLLAILSQPLTGFPASAAMVPVEEVRVISTSLDGSPANNFSTFPSISSDGEKIAFVSAANNLVNGDSNQVSDVFLHTKQSSAIESLSRSPQGVLGNGASFEPAISGDGNVVVFTSLATNLTSGDTNGVADIYLCDLVNGTIERVSITSDGMQPDGWSDQPAASGDGRFVVFRSAADNLVPSDRYDAAAIYLYDRRHKTLRRVSETGQGASHPAISMDGRTIVYISTSPDGDQLFIFNRVIGKTEKVNASGWKLPSGYSFGQPELSADGRFLAVHAANQQITTYYLLDTTTQQLQTIAVQNSSTTPRLDPEGAALSMDGRWMAFPSKTGLAIWDRESGSANNLQSSQSAAINNAQSPAIALTQDGLRVTFSSPGSGTENIYLADTALELGATRFVTGWVSDEAGHPLGNVAISDGVNYLAYTTPDGSFAFEGYINRTYQLSPEKKGYSFSPSRLAVRVSPSGEYGIEYSGSPVDVIEEARLDIGMPYSLHRGCESPYQGCNGPYHGFYSGDCTDLVMDAYLAGVDFNIQLALERDVFNNPRHYYLWRDVRS